MAENETRDFYKDLIIEMVKGVHRIGILQYIYILTEDIVKEDTKEVSVLGEVQP